MDPLKPSVNNILNFLCAMYNNGAKYSAIGMAHSAVFHCIVGRKTGFR